MPIDQLVKEFMEVHGKLREQFGDNEKIARAMKFDSRTIRRAKRGETSAATVTMMLERAKNLLEAKSPQDDALPASEGSRITSESVTAGSTKRAPEETSDGSGTVTDGETLLRDCAGTTSPRGVRYVLGAASFRNLEGDPGRAGIEAAKRYLAHAQALLNILMQCEDTNVRRRIRKELAASVEEMNTTLQLFSAEFPNKLTKLIDDHRDVMNALEGKPSSRKGVKK